MSVRGFKSLAFLAAAVLAAAVAVAAYGRSAADIYTVHALVSDSSATPAGANDCVARQRLGPERRADDAVVGGEQRLEHLDALQR